MRKINLILVILISFLLLSSIVYAQVTPLDMISNFLNNILNLFKPTAEPSEKVIPSSGSIVYNKFKDKVLWENSFEIIQDYYYVGGSNEGTGWYWSYYGWGGLDGDELGGWDTGGIDNGAEIFKSSEVVRSGDYSYKGVHNNINDKVTHTAFVLGSIDDPIYGDRGAGPNHMAQSKWKEAYYSYWYYFPENFELHYSGSCPNARLGHCWLTIGGLVNYWFGTTLIPSSDTPHGSWKMRFGASSSSKGEDYVKITASVTNYDVPTATEKHFGHLDVLKGKWVQLQIYWKVDKDNGAYEFWINGDSLGRKEGVCTDPRYCGDRFPDGDPEAPMYPEFVMDFYTSDYYPYENAPTPYYVYVDDAVIASEFVPLDYHP